MPLKGLILDKLKEINLKVLEPSNMIMEIIFRVNLLMGDVREEGDI